MTPHTMIILAIGLPILAFIIGLSGTVGQVHSERKRERLVLAVQRVLYQDEIDALASRLSDIDIVEINLTICEPRLAGEIRDALRKTLVDYRKAC